MPIRTVTLFSLNQKEKIPTKSIYKAALTSLPVHVQNEIIATLPGFENARMVRPAYAVEYDYLPAIQFHHSLMSKDLEGFFAAAADSWNKWL